MFPQLPIYRGLLVDVKPYPAHARLCNRCGSLHKSGVALDDANGFEDVVRSELAF